MSVFRRKKHQPSNPVRSPRGHGQKSAPVFSYYSSRNPHEAGRERRVETVAQPHKRRVSRWLLYLPSILSLGVVVMSGIFLTTLTANPKISILTPENNLAVVQDTQTYEQAAERLMRRSLLSRSKFTIRTDELAAALQQEFPELGDVVVTVPLISRRAVIEVQPATPVLLLRGSNGTFVIDKLGRPVLEAARLSSSVRDKLPVVSDESDTELLLGRQQLTLELTAFIQDTHAQFTGLGIITEAYTLPSLANELHVRLPGKGYYVKFNTEAEARQQVGTYMAVKGRLESEGITPSEYIDVRVEERAYYK